MGLLEEEFKTFQPFFAELDPPKTLTTGDKIWLPVPLRNYTNSKQDIDVDFDAGSGLKLIGPASTRIDVSSDSTETSIFGFQAQKQAYETTLKVIAKGFKVGDAIERKVDVMPNARANHFVRSGLVVSRSETIMKSRYNQ